MACSSFSMERKLSPAIRGSSALEGDGSQPSFRPKALYQRRRISNLAEPRVDHEPSTGRAQPRAEVPLRGAVFPCKVRDHGAVGATEDNQAAAVVDAVVEANVVLETRPDSATRIDLTEPQPEKCDSFFGQRQADQRLQREVGRAANGTPQPQDFYVNPVCMQMDTLLLKSESAEEILTLLVSHRGVMFLHNLVTALELLADFASAGSPSDRREKRLHSGEYVNISDHLAANRQLCTGLPASNTTSRGQLGNQENPDDIGSAGQPASGAPRMGAGGQGHLHLVGGDCPTRVMPRGWPQEQFAYEHFLAEGSTSTKACVSLDGIPLQASQAEGVAMHGRSVADWIIRDERYEVLVQDLRFHRRSLSFEAAAKVVLSLRRLEHRHYPLLSAMLHPLARREITLPALETCSFASAPGRGFDAREHPQQCASHALHDSGIQAAQSPSKSRQKKFDSVVQRRLDVLLQCAGVYAWAGYIQHPFFDRVAALFLSAMPSELRDPPATLPSSFISLAFHRELHCQHDDYRAADGSDDVADESRPPLSSSLKLDGSQIAADQEGFSGFFHKGSSAAGEGPTGAFHTRGREAEANPVDTVSPSNGISALQGHRFTSASSQKHSPESITSVELRASPALIVRALDIFSSLRVEAGHKVVDAAANRLMKHMADLSPDQLAAAAAAVTKTTGYAVLCSSTKDSEASSLPSSHDAPCSVAGLSARVGGQVAAPEGTCGLAHPVAISPTGNRGADHDTVVPLPHRPTNRALGRFSDSEAVWSGSERQVMETRVRSIPDRLLVAVASRLERDAPSFSLPSIVTVLRAFRRRKLHFPSCISVAVSRAATHLRLAANIRQQTVLTVDEIGQLVEACAFFGERPPAMWDPPSTTTVRPNVSGVPGHGDANTNELVDAAAAYLEQHLDEMSEQTAIRVTFALAAVDGATSRHAYLLSFAFRKIGKGTAWQGNKVAIFQLWLSHMLQFPWLRYNMPQRCVFEGLRAWCMQRGGYGAPFPRVVAEVSELLKRRAVAHAALVKVPASPYELDILLRSSGGETIVIMVTNECAPNTFAPVGGSRLQEVHLALAGFPHVAFLHQATWNSLPSEVERARFLLRVLQSVSPWPSSAEVCRRLREFIGNVLVEEELDTGGSIQTDR
ncbi:hypothetical protein BESB_082730 [Besnoitia besnoiti]|uniref:RAP domain-containing protein n=1 Tax=Besnoitia besnoiti TaxID=94643 RepID=A0A2A9M7B2_BESBE|nr:hypothetical protein BESB_082730 [Besnoitia besnoiti]PFH33074.1 hypothetical protein BESB_082730 [Besnoitia besnoiti]